VWLRCATPPAENLELVRRWVSSCCHRYPEMYFVVARYPWYPTWVLWTEVEWRRLSYHQQEARSPLEIWRNGECFEYSPELLP
jgi:hypothetical protein